MNYFCTMRILCLTSNEYCHAADSSDVQRQIDLQLKSAAQTNSSGVSISGIDNEAFPYTLVHMGSGSFARHDKTHHQSDHNYVWSILDVPVNGVDVKKTIAPHVYIACFQEMFVKHRLHRKRRSTASLIHPVMEQHNFMYHYKVDAKGLIGEANAKSMKSMGAGIYVWSRFKLTTLVPLCSKQLFAKHALSTKRMQRLVLVSPHFTLSIANVHLPMKENIHLDGRHIKKHNPMKQNERNDMLTKVLHAMYIEHDIKQAVMQSEKQKGGRYSRHGYPFTSGETHPTSPSDYASVFSESDMMTGQNDSANYTRPPIDDTWTDLVYKWIRAHRNQPKLIFCPTCEFKNNRTLRKLPRPRKSHNRTSKRRSFASSETRQNSPWMDVPMPPQTRHARQWKKTNQITSYQLVKHGSYNLPSYCDRMLMKVKRGYKQNPHIQLVVGDMNYRILPDSFLNTITASSND